MDVLEPREVATDHRDRRGSALAPCVQLKDRSLDALLCRSRDDTPLTINNLHRSLYCPIPPFPLVRTPDARKSHHSFFSV